MFLVRPHDPSSSMYDLSDASASLVCVDSSDGLSPGSRPRHESERGGERDAQDPGRERVAADSDSLAGELKGEDVREVVQGGLGDVVADMAWSPGQPLARVQDGTSSLCELLVCALMEVTLMIVLEQPPSAVPLARRCRNATAVK